MYKCTSSLYPIIEWILFLRQKYNVKCYFLLFTSTTFAVSGKVSYNNYVSKKFSEV
ncbi:hypothetical protein HMPREF9376_02218 [Enterococcus faecalis S613]|nr:hypothetical protein HMPREF9376_02218 [Enterococcus faecalis S613]EFQ09172.1 hypothetical protein HMPREF9492_02458 [Enterococcus faecalis DAPTO 512]